MGGSGNRIETAAEEKRESIVALPREHLGATEARIPAVRGARTNPNKGSCSTKKRLIALVPARSLEASISCPVIRSL
jgi:hypothetical protein